MYLARLMSLSKIFIDHMSYLSILSSDSMIYSDNLNIFFNTLSTFSFIDDYDFILNCVFGASNIFLAKLLISIYIFPIFITIFLLLIFYTFARVYVITLGVKSHFKLCFAIIYYNLQPLIFTNII